MGKIALLAILGLTAAVAAPPYTEYPFVGHDAWDPTFNSPDLGQWLLQQRRGAGKRAS